MARFTKRDGDQRSYKSEYQRKYGLLKLLLGTEMKEPVTLSQLATQLGGSRNTIRKDLEDLKKDFDFQPRTQSEKTKRPDLRLQPIGTLFDPRNVDHSVQKQSLAEDVWKWVKRYSGDFKKIYLDGGTTARILYELLAEDPPAGNWIKIYTDDLMTAAWAAQTSTRIQTLLLPGKVTANYTVAGQDTVDFVTQLRFEIAILSCSEIATYTVWSRKGSAKKFMLISTAASDEVNLKRAVMRRAQSVILLADSSKFSTPVEIERGQFETMRLHEDYLKDQDDRRIIEGLKRELNHTLFAYVSNRNDSMAVSPYEEIAGTVAASPSGSAEKPLLFVNRPDSPNDVWASIYSKIESIFPCVFFRSEDNRDTIVQEKRKGP